MKLRPYQEDAIQRVRQEMLAGRKRVLLVIATGGGKTVTSSSVIKSAVAKGKRCIFLAHRSELIQQCSKTLDFLGVDHGVIKRGHKKLDMNKPVQVASIQTLIRREHWHADLVVIDEAHRSMAATYQELVSRYEQNNAAILGLTATPYRLDGKPLGDMYDSLVETITTQELIDDGYLINPTVFGSSNIDLSKVDVGSRGDYNRGQLGQAMASTIIHGELLTNWARLCGKALGSETVWYKDSEGRDRVSETNCDACTVIFAPNVKKSIEIAEQFQEAGVRAAHLDGKTKPRERRRILEKLSAGELDVVSNVDILTEGWDLPRLECVIGARPTRSKNIYKQMGGRLMRPDDEKRIAFLLDHANWTRTHGFLYEPTKHSLDKPEKRARRGSGGAPLKECPQCESVSFIGATKCPECGYIWPKGSIETTDEELVELDGQMVNRAEVVPRSERQEAFDKLATQCASKGYKPNWARVRYRNAYGEWPGKGCGISTPHFFRKYEREFKKRLEQQMLVQAAADAVAS
jgi:DNA repair protein RadD